MLSRISFHVLYGRGVTQVLEDFNKSSPVERTKDMITGKWAMMNGYFQRVGYGEQKVYSGVAYIKGPPQMDTPEPVNPEDTTGHPKLFGGDTRELPPGKLRKAKKTNWTPRRAPHEVTQDLSDVLQSEFIRKPEASEKAYEVVTQRRRKRKLQRRQQAENSVYEDGDVDEISTAKSLQYSFGVIREATDDFSENNKLGQGGFGLVYKGKLRNGQEIAVKRLSRDSGQGELEFKNEVLLLAKLQHRNLVRLLGYSIEGSERLLMYEFVENASLDQLIFLGIDRVRCI
nr:concanavalin A-like lectin/glucanase, subgroup [Tanacetum cinerariifolium]